MNSADIEIANSNDYVFRGVKTGDLVVHMTASNAGFHVGSSTGTPILSVGNDIIRIGSESNSHIGISNNILKVVTNGSGGSGNGVGVMFIKDSNVGVGVGKSNPIYTVDVAGDLNVSGEIRRNGEIFVGGSGGLGGGGWSNKGSNIFVVGSNVGIGISNPTYQLEVTQSAKLGGALTIENGAIYLPNTVTFNGFSINQRESNMGITNLGVTPQFNTVMGSNIYLPPGSNLGIGTSNPIGALDVVGDINFSGDLKKNGVIYGGIGGGGGWSNTGSNIFVVGSNVGIGTSNPSGALQVVGNLVMSGDILPNQTLVRNIGASNSRIKNLWVDTIYLGSNTLYIGDTPVLGTNQNTIQIAADPDQGVTMKTSGTGITTVTSTAGVNVNASGLNAQVQVQSTGTGGRVVMGAAQEVSINSSSFNITASNTLMNGDMTVNGNLTVTGSNFIANVQTVEIKDNILVLNKGQVGSGVSAGKAGLAIDRGDASRYEFIFEESSQTFQIGPVGATDIIASRSWTSNNYANIAVSNIAYSALPITGGSINGSLNITGDSNAILNVYARSSISSILTTTKTGSGLDSIRRMVFGQNNFFNSIQSEIASGSSWASSTLLLNPSGGGVIVGGILTTSNTLTGGTINAMSTLQIGGSNVSSLFAPIATSNVAFSASNVAFNSLPLSGGTLTGTLTGTTINATTLQQGGTSVNSLFAPIITSNITISASNRAFGSLALTGGTLTGTLTGTTIDATTLQQGGTSVSSLFAPIATSNVAYGASNTAVNALTAAQTASNLAVGASNAASTSSNAAFSGSNRAFGSLALTGGTLTGTLTGTTINANTLQQGGTNVNSLFAATSHNHDASAITSGTLDVARGGTGVTSSTGTGSVVLSASPTFTGSLNVNGDLNVNGNFNAGNLEIFRNRIINGSMRICQRSTNTYTPSNGAVVYAVDRMSCYKVNGASLIFSQSNINYQVPEFGFALKVTVNTANTVISAGDHVALVEHRIEGVNIADIQWGTANAKSVTISFWFYSSLSTTTTFFLSLQNSITTPTRSYIAPFNVPSNAWNKYTFTVNGDTTGMWAKDNSVGLVIGIYTGTGSTFTATNSSSFLNTWFDGNLNVITGTGAYNVLGAPNAFVSVSNAFCMITGLQLEKGTICTPFEHRPYGIELQLCQRYYTRNPLQSYNRGDGTYNTCVYTISIPHGATMRATPTLSIQSGGLTNSSIIDSYASTICSGFAIKVTGGLFTVDTAYAANAEL